MRLILVGVLSLWAMGEACAAGSLAFGKHTIACQSYQDLIDLDVKDQTTFQKIVPPPQLMLRYADQTCREYRAGTTVEIDKETTAEGLNFVCVKGPTERSCFWAIKEDD